MSRSTTERDESALEWAHRETWSRRDLALAAGFDPHPDDLTLPAAHLQAGEGVDVPAAFAEEVRRIRERSDQ